MDYGKITCRIEDVLQQKGLSKNKVCKDLDIPRTNFNRYCANRFQRIDAALLCKLCFYLEVSPSDLFEYVRPE